MSTKCPCGSTKTLEDCCQPLLDGEPATSPEHLMRSRFTAFVVKNIEYVQATTDPQSRHEFDLVATQAWADSSEFFKLEILRTSAEGNKGMVEFKAHFRGTDGKDQIHHEISKFRKQAGVWYFRDGKLVAPPNPS